MNPMERTQQLHFAIGLHSRSMDSGKNCTVYRLLLHTCKSFPGIGKIDRRPNRPHKLEACQLQADSHRLHHSKENLHPTLKE